jgi:hypothetical protein
MTFRTLLPKNRYYSSTSRPHWMSLSASAGVMSRNRASNNYGLGIAAGGLDGPKGINRSESSCGRSVSNLEGVLTDIRQTLEANN